MADHQVRIRAALDKMLANMQRQEEIEAAVAALEEESSQLSRENLRLSEEVRDLTAASAAAARPALQVPPTEVKPAREPIDGNAYTKTDQLLAYLHHIRRLGKPFDGSEAARMMYPKGEGGAGYRRVYATLSYLKNSGKVDENLNPRLPAPSAPVRMPNGEVILEAG